MKMRHGQDFPPARPGLARPGLARPSPDPLHRTQTTASLSSEAIFQSSPITALSHRPRWMKTEEVVVEKQNLKALVPGLIPEELPQQ